MKKKKFEIKIRLLYELSNFPKIDLPRPCCVSLCEDAPFAHQRWLVGSTGNARRQWKRREKRDLVILMESLSKTLTPLCSRPGVQGRGGRGGACIVHSAGDCDNVFLVAQKEC